MRRFVKPLLSLLLVFCVSLPLVSESTEVKQPFLAVFAQPGVRNLNDWNKFHPDLFVTAESWDQFDGFCKEVKRKAGNRPILLDIECHGSPASGMLVIEYEAFKRTFDDVASLGFVVNRINKNLKGSNLTVLLEACNSAVVVQRTLKTNKMLVSSETLHVENSTDPIKFPIYGIGRPSNYNNLIFLQYHYGVRVRFVDLREYIDKELVTPDESEETADLLKLTYVILISYGI